MSRVDDVLRAAEALASAPHPIGRLAREAAIRECSLSHAMADHVFALSCARYTRGAVESLVSDERNGMKVAVSLAATVAVAPLRAIALPWLAGAERVEVRGSSRQSALVEAIAHAFGRDEIAMCETLPADADLVVAYGSDETVDALACSLPSSTRFEGYGHGFGVAWIERDEDPTAVALDVALHDQRGCLSPLAVFVRGDARAFARALHEALGRLEETLPRGRVDAGEAAAAMQWQGAAAARCVWSRRGKTHFVGALEDAAFIASPGLRNVLVCEARDASHVMSLLGDEGAHLTCVGATDADLAWPLAGVRVVRAGTMQDPALDGPEDRRAPRSVRHTMPRRA